MSETPSPADRAAPPGRHGRFLTARNVGIASGVTGAAAAIALIFATQVAVHASAEQQPTPAVTMAADSTDADAPEKAAEVVKPAAVAAPLDQRSGEEVEYVRHLGAQHPEFAAGADVFGGAGLQFLSTDVADTGSYTDGQRRFVSLYYDYATNETVSFVVNVTTGAVEKTTRATGSQPAPTKAETAYAWKLLLDAESSAPLREEFASHTGGATLTPESPEVFLTAHSFVSDAAALGAEECGVQRCLQILAQVSGGPYLTTSTYIVNLSTRTVLTIA